MRRVFLTWILAGAAFAAVAALSQLAANSRYLARSASALRAIAAGRPPAAPWEKAARRAQVLERAFLYESLITRGHLQDGMLVNRTSTGLRYGQCDSLLFSSLRFVGLTKLGMRSEAAAAWSGIRNAEVGGRWVRHPRCTLSTSRDMILGVLAALSQRPPGSPQIFRRLLAALEADGGYISKGPIYVSLLTPGIARLMARLAPHLDVNERDLPAVVREGFSTHEFGATVVEPGFEAHLAALTVWLELEADDLDREARRRFAPQAIDHVMQPLTNTNMGRHRLDWTAHRLVQLDPQNGFFRYLRLRSAGALSPTMADELLTELLAMPEFPADRLPADCDRGADYLWQRASRERRPAGWFCDRIYGGADFLWLAGLLTTSPRISRTADVAP